MTGILPDLQRDSFYYRGRVALHAILRGLGIGAGHEVALQAFTCLAVPEAIQAVGARPRFVDIEPEGFNMDPDRLAALLTPQTRAIVVQHTFGIPADLPRLIALAESRNIPLIEDCCHTFHSSVAGQAVGSFGHAAFYSYEWGKPLVLGLGGSARANDAALREKLEREYTTCYRTPPPLRQARLEMQYLMYSLLYRPSLYWQVRRAFRALSSVGAAEGNFHADSTKVASDFRWRMAPLLLRRFSPKMRHLNEHPARSVQICGEYAKIRSSSVRHPAVPQGSTAVFARYPLRVDRKAELLREAERAHVELADWYMTPIHPLSAAECARLGVSEASCPHAYRRCDEVVSLPVNRRVDSRGIARTVATLGAH